ncbi:opsin 8, group member c [Spinachia spinachia]
MVTHLCTRNRVENRTGSPLTSKLGPAADICAGLAVLCVVVFFVLGDGLVLVICYRRSKKMVGSELLCVNLAVVDFLCCVCFYPLSTNGSICVRIRTKKGVWLEGANIRIACCCFWLVAAARSSFPLFGWGKYVPEPYGLSCTIAWRADHTSAKDSFYVICSFACFTLLPLLLTVVSQCQILCEVSRFSNSLSARRVRNNLKHADKRLSVVSQQKGNCVGVVLGEEHLRLPQMFYIHLAFAYIKLCFLTLDPKMKLKHLNLIP